MEEHVFSIQGFLLIQPIIQRSLSKLLFSAFALLTVHRALVAGIRNNGTRPCHRCLVLKSDLSKLGSPTDVERSEKVRVGVNQTLAVNQAREEIVKNNYAVDSNRVDDKLKPESLVPVEVCYLLMFFQ